MYANINFGIMAYMSMGKFPQVKSTPYPFLSNSPNSSIDNSKFHPGLLKKWLGLIRSPLKHGAIL